MRVVKFLKKYTKYNQGEVAGFDDLKAKRLVDQGFGVYVEVSEKKEKPSLSSRPSLKDKMGDKQAAPERGGVAYQTK